MFELWIRPLGKYFRLSINRCRHDEDGLLLKIFSETVRASANFNSFSESLQPLQYDPSPGNSSQPSSLASRRPQSISQSIPEDDSISRHNCILVILHNFFLSLVQINVPLTFCPNSTRRPMASTHH
ncbi:hypothetical protein Pst134EA_032933 [Puccinia striiformis f. sp. tritici]|uniref:uncharacterized protein n=1 Tax=Puccinia striiformis f. sp. tritici TaxID=168172 RepID=UPI002007DF64|nr:uncharacterized protein Pst134EA_032933 [Puccinia striiformis f. sp. tritici]KAH9443482.1 hypothetical protein Pst134EA_032933 [Puccinia striiformis f. sp. tritici]